MDKDVLLSCKECGKPGYLYHYDKDYKDNQYYMVWCDGDCDSSKDTEHYKTAKEAINAWNIINTRPPQERCELRKLDEKEVMKLFEVFQLTTDEHDSNNFPCIPRWNFEDLIHFICENFGTAPAQKMLSSQEWHEIENKYWTMVKGQTYYFPGIIGAIKAKLGNDLPVQKTLSLEEIDKLITDSHFFRSCISANAHQYEYRMELCGAIKAKMEGER